METKYNKVEQRDENDETEANLAAFHAKYVSIALAILYKTVPLMRCVWSLFFPHGNKNVICSGTFVVFFVHDPIPNGRHQVENSRTSIYIS